MWKKNQRTWFSECLTNISAFAEVVITNKILVENETKIEFDWNGKTWNEVKNRRAIVSLNHEHRAYSDKKLLILRIILKLKE